MKNKKHSALGPWNRFNTVWRETISIYCQPQINIKIYFDCCLYCWELACDKMCKVSKMFWYRLDSGSVILTDDGTLFVFDVGFLASFSKIQGKIYINSNFFINFIQKVQYSFAQHFLAAFWLLFSGIPFILHCILVDSRIAKDSQFWLFFTILAIWLSAYTK